MKISKKQRDLLREFVNYTCEQCSKTELDLSSKYSKIIKLEIHRIKQGGDYSLRNIKVICPDCHKIFSSAQNKASGNTA